MMQAVKSFAEGLAEDSAIDKFNELSGKYIKTKDPYRETFPDGSTRKLKLPHNATKQEQKQWKKIQRRAWLDDKCFMGCYPVDCGCGLGPVMVIIPAIGPYLMYLVHLKLIRMAVSKFHIDAATQAKLHANILFDLLITLPPVIGSFFAWLNGCSTRNAAIIHTEIKKQLLEREKAHEQQGKPVANANNAVNSSYKRSDYSGGSQTTSLEQKRPNRFPVGTSAGSNDRKYRREASSYHPSADSYSNHGSTSYHGNGPSTNRDKPLPNLPSTPTTPNRAYSENPFVGTSPYRYQSSNNYNTPPPFQKKEKSEDFEDRHQTMDSKEVYYPSSPKSEVYYSGTTTANDRNISSKSQRKPPPGYTHH